VLPDHVVGGTTGYGFEGGQNLVESGVVRVEPPSSDFGATGGAGEAEAEPEPEVEEGEAGWRLSVITALWIKHWAGHGKGKGGRAQGRQQSGAHQETIAARCAVTDGGITAQPGCTG
jgi:hypothetical protein